MNTTHRQGFTALLCLKAMTPAVNMHATMLFVHRHDLDLSASRLLHVTLIVNKSALGLSWGTVCRGRLGNVRIWPQTLGQEARPPPQGCW